MCEISEAAYEEGLDRFDQWFDRMKSGETIENLAKEIKSAISAIDDLNNPQEDQIFLAAAGRESYEYYLSNFIEIFKALDLFDQQRLLNIYNCVITQDPNQKKLTKLLAKLKDEFLKAIQAPLGDFEEIFEEIFAPEPGKVFEAEILHAEQGDKWVEIIQESEDNNELRNIALTIQSLILSTQNKVVDEMDDVVRKTIQTTSSEDFEPLNKGASFSENKYELLQLFCLSLSQIRNSRSALDNLKFVLNKLNDAELITLIEIYEFLVDESKPKVTGLFRKAISERDNVLASLSQKRRQVQKK